MAVSAYASVLSLVHVLDHIQHPSRHRFLPNMKQIETLREKVHFLQEFLELHSATKIEGMEDLIKRITAVADEAEDIIDSHVVDQLHGGSQSTTDIGLSSFCQDIEKVIGKIDSIKKELLTMVKEGMAVQEHAQPRVSQSAAGPSTLPSRGKNTVVGFDEHLVRIMDQLTGNHPNLQIIPIVGMGGIGKTTLARIVFENKYVVEKFDVRVWFTISQEYSVHEILLRILCDIGVTDDLKSETLVELGQRLHKYLYGRRYLIVMDDLWSTNGWDDFKLSFPNNGNGSRVMITTRLSNVAASLASYNPYLMDFLDEKTSWDLLCEKAFSQEKCSPKLKEIGKGIAKSCKGLPLAIVVIGGLLAKSNMTREYWESVARKVNLLVSSENDEHCFKILSLSYNHLPIHLKPCFLYMGFFPEDCEIGVSDLIKSWVVGGFLKPRRGKSLEEIANEYLKDLIERNLLLIRKLGLLGEIISCGIHDLLRDLCWRESVKEHFLSVPKSQHFDLRLKENDERRCSLICEGVKIHLPKVLVGSRSTSLVSPLVGNSYQELIRLSSLGVKYGRHYEELPLYTKLRCLVLKFEKSLDFLSPSTISQFWNLQSLYLSLYFYGKLYSNVVLPSEIWEMPQLRYVIIPQGFYLPTVTKIEREYFIVLENLHTLDKILNFRCTEDAVKRISNLKELRISYYNQDEVDWSYYCLHNIANLHKLESLVLDNYTSSYESIAFPYSLKKLRLSRCTKSWKDVIVIGSLPNLEIFELYGKASGAASGMDEWNSVEGGFRQLKLLSISGSIPLKCWRAESTHFPKLEVLQLIGMRYLMEIPGGIGEIEALRIIDLKGCPSSVVESAKEIWEEQQNFGNEDFQLIIDDERYEK
ncbi:hypothetical protein BUALT_Bualt07G0040800 [Buddleja alternifolia]|uniref:NB-ARC domain-containing protein n=1 Tax=Buddleja alternifolia TaxID=168488 RepID=A0AAV6XC56_9LAMI|nr:hypothetical protein BUALT_Bualt07G0040800 [Buddleja alternifolia]